VPDWLVPMGRAKPRVREQPYNRRGGQFVADFIHYMIYYKGNTSGAMTQKQ
jgi:hypothetical protein